jgi:hypothetical protein
MSNPTIDILKRSISEARRRLVVPTEKVIKSGKVILKMSQLKEGSNKSSEAKNGAKND